MQNGTTRKREYGTTDYRTTGLAFRGRVCENAAHLPDASVLPTNPTIQQSNNPQCLSGSVAAFRENAADLMRMSVFPTNPPIEQSTNPQRLTGPVAAFVKTRLTCRARRPLLSGLVVRGLVVSWSRSPIGPIGPISATNTPKLRNEPKRKPPNPNEINLSGPTAASPALKRTHFSLSANPRQIARNPP